MLFYISTGIDEHCDSVERILKSQRQSAKVCVIDSQANLLIFAIDHKKPIEGACSVDNI